MRALVVDDEPLVRGELVYALGRVAELDVAEAADATEALGRLAREPFDVVFLDINLPGLDGVAASRVVARLAQPPEIVFVTAEEGHAVDAFEIAAADYLVKPVSEERLALAIERVRARRRAAPPEPSSGNGEGNGAPGTGKVALEDGERVRLVRIGEIRFVEANGHVVTARLFDATLRWRGSLAECARRLEPAGFLRVHRAYLVNPEHVVEVEPFFGGSYLLRVDDKSRSEVPVSRGMMPAVRKAFGL